MVPRATGAKIPTATALRTTASTPEELPPSDAPESEEESSAGTSAVVLVLVVEAVDAGDNVEEVPLELVLDPVAVPPLKLVCVLVSLVNGDGLDVLSSSVARSALKVTD
mmetsp:Transcript_16923/g.39510  ORF Transcript_16923/g.39510 Transcript_16923/m.39510 type:complete len:109 (-) Transcript_16923:1394-1720(-)